MISLGADVSGEFRVVKHRCGEITEDRRFTNLVMASPFNALIDALRGDDAWRRAQYLFLGTGGSEPTVSDTGLEARSGLAGCLSSGQTFTNWLDPPNGERWADVTLQYDFAVGEATGEWSEIGAAADAGYAAPYNRALIRDENNAATSLIVFNDEALTVYLTLRLREGLRFSVRGSTVYRGTNIGFTLTPLNSRYWATDGYNPWQSGYCHQVMRLLGAGGSPVSFQTQVESYPWPFFNNLTGASPSISYSHDLASRTTTASYTLVDSYEDVEIHGIEFSPTTSSADRIYELTFDTPLVKPAYDTLTFDVAITFTRGAD